MAGRYRALLIGNATYPADQHNLQPLKGPVKDIAAVSEALADSATGLFAEADVTRLPEVTSTAAIRAMGRFFGAAERDDVLLLYFSGHGKLDQAARLHLCMQDTETTDLLSTAVSSSRINEFADASRARNIVIVLDCCFSGAFRGADLGDAVAGPGRYVLTSCRGTQLANDATAGNSTSFFTQHLVEGLLGAAEDHDGDGYVTFSELYAYVDRRLRASGKQIPQRRVTGDGDLRLARRPQPAPPEAAPPAGGTAGTGEAGPPGTTAGALPRVPAGRGLVLAAAAAAVAVAAGGTAAGLLLTDGGNGAVPGGSYTSPQTYRFTSPWRLKLAAGDTTPDGGCTLWVVNAVSGAARELAAGLYGMSVFQVSDTGSFRWRTNDPTNSNCVVVALSGTDKATLPFPLQQHETGDTAVFPVSTASVTVHVTNFDGNADCGLALFDPANGQRLDFAVANAAQGGTVSLQTGGVKQAYLQSSNCYQGEVSAGT